MSRKSGHRFCEKGYARTKCVRPRGKAPAPAPASPRTGFHCPGSCARPLPMNRTGLVIALLAGVGVGVVFGLWPQLDIAISRMFFDEARGTFPALYSLASRHLRDLFTYIVAALAAPA